MEDEGKSVYFRSGLQCPGVLLKAVLTAGISSHASACAGIVGIWEGFIPGSTRAVFTNTTSFPNLIIIKPTKRSVFRLTEVAPKTASIVWNLDYAWKDREWMKNRRAANMKAPMSIYEIHFGSWRRVMEEKMHSLSYRSSSAPR